MHMYCLYLNFEKVTQHAFVYDSHFSTKEGRGCCDAIIDNRSYAPIYILERKYIISKGALKNILRKFFDDNCIVEFSFKVTAHEST